MLETPPPKIFDAAALCDEDAELARRYPQRTAVSVAPDVLYPRTIERIRHVLAMGNIPTEEGGIRQLPGELVDAEHRGSPDTDPLAAARRLRRWARDLPAAAWEDALAPRAAFGEPPTPDLSLDRLLRLLRDDAAFASFAAGSGDTAWLRRILARAAALEVARVWFTRALKNQLEGELALRITRDAAFRL